MVRAFRMGFQALIRPLGSPVFLGGVAQRRAHQVDDAELDLGQGLGGPDRIREALEAVAATRARIIPGMALDQRDEDHSSWGDQDHIVRR